MHRQIKLRIALLGIESGSGPAATRLTRPLLETESSDWSISSLIGTGEEGKKELTPRRVQVDGVKKRRSGVYGLSGPVVLENEVIRSADREQVAES